MTTKYPGLTEEHIEIIKRKLTFSLGEGVSFSEMEDPLLMQVHIPNASFAVFPCWGMMNSLDGVLCFFLRNEKFVYKNIDIFSSCNTTRDGYYYIDYTTLLEILNEQHNTEIGQFCKDDEFPSKSDF